MKFIKILYIIIIIGIVYYAYDQYKMKMLQENFVNPNDENASFRNFENEELDVIKKLCENESLLGRTSELVAPTPPNVPDGKANYMRTPNVSISFGEKNGMIAPQNGIWKFPIPQWMFDGIWDRKCIQNKDYEKCGWKMTTNDGEQYNNNMYYSSDKYLPIAELPFSPDIQYITPLDCSEKDKPYNGNKDERLAPLSNCLNKEFCCKPDLEDILGYAIAP